MSQYREANRDPQGPSIKYVTLFWTNFDPLPPPVTLCHTSQDPTKVRHTSRTPQFLVVQRKPDKKLLYKSLFLRDLRLKGFVLGGFCLFPFCQNTAATAES